MLLLALISFALLAFPVAALAYFVARKSFANRSWTRADILALGISGCFMILLFMRPHEHVYQALDSSAFRHMARAFLEGRSFHDVDQALLDLPEELRLWVLQSPEEYLRGNRFTRDRSFQILAIDEPVTQPFFYPLLPLSMVGLDRWVPGVSMDYLTPLIFLIFALSILCFAAGRGGCPAMLLAVGLLIGSPLPAWLGRGCYLESIAAALVGLALLGWFQAEATRRTPPVVFMALGLAVAYHPVMMLFVLPLGGCMLVSLNSMRRTLACLAAGLFGMAPLILMNEWICAPYGALRPDALRHTLIANASIRPAAFIALLMGGGMLVLAPLRGWLRSLRIPKTVFPVLRALLCISWMVPTWLALQFWEHGQQAVVWRGVREFYDGMQWYFALWVALLLVIIGLIPKCGRQRAGITSVALVIPLFFYLKGAEGMGLWSQRRLVVPWMLMVVCCLPACAWVAERMRACQGWKRAASWALLPAIAAACLANPLRWPAPYTVRYEAGADAFNRDIEQVFGDEAIVFFDYHAHSLPLAVLPGRKVYGLSEDAAPGLPMLSSWIREQAATGSVFWVTAYRNPGIEDGVRLERRAQRSVSLTRARARTALPATREPRRIDLEILKVTPVASGSQAALDKVFELGRRPGRNRPQLAVRGRWGRSDIPLTGPGRQRLPAQWTREESAVIGPLPPPGGRVRVVLEGAAVRQDERPSQVIRVVPPWNGEGLDLVVNNEYTLVEGVLERPATDRDDPRPTGVYRLEPRWPYDPASVGIPGFHSDLGILLHRIRIAVYDTPLEIPR